MIKRLLATLALVVLVATGASAQVTVPNTLVSGAVITASGLNTNFTTIANHSLDRISGGTISGNIAVDPGITIDGVDIGATVCTVCSPTFAALTLTGGLTAGSGVVGIINAAGQIPAISSTFFASLSGANLTGLNASNISSGTLAIAQGGTNGSGTPTNGGVIYGTGTAYAASAAGTSNQVLQANGAASPTWVTSPTIGVANVTGNLAYARLPTGNGTWAIGGTLTLSQSANADFAVKITQLNGGANTDGGLFISTVSTAVKVLDLQNSGSDLFFVAGDGTIVSLQLAAPVAHQYYLCIGSTGLIVSQTSACLG